ncbi:hypothetical protein F4808DRAFT_15251 [Astrocystis sublimbata]|nr:hypothetical protein F4808DRAFT_15251 [Astrocystis sublimbata]
MDDYSNDAQTYDYEAYNALLAQNSSVWSTFPTTSTLMTRGPSADSSFSTSSGDLIRTPISEYDTHESFWSPVIVVSDDYLVSSLHPDSLHETTFSPIGYNLPYTEEYTNDDGNQYNDVTDEFWWNDYDFVTDLEPGQSPYWRLKQGQEPTDQLPATRAHEDTSATTE